MNHVPRAQRNRQPGDSTDWWIVTCPCGYRAEMAGINDAASRELARQSANAHKRDARTAVAA